MEVFEIISVTPRKPVEPVVVLEVKKTAFELLNPPREDGYPIVKELNSRTRVIPDAKDPNYFLPLSNLYKDYSV